MEFFPKLILIVSMITSINNNMKIYELETQYISNRCFNHNISKDDVIKTNLNNGLSLHECWQLLSPYIKLAKRTKKISTKRTRHIRRINFLESISENIVRNILQFLYTKPYKWDGVKSGDLMCEDSKIEVKAFSTAKSPISFGPTEKWDVLYICDATRFDECYFELYEINLSNDSAEWGKLKVSKTDCFNDQCKQKRRPRLHFSSIKEQLGTNCKKVYGDYIYK